jgi:cytochrome c peroxidase
VSLLVLTLGLALVSAAEMPPIPAGLDAYLPVPASNPLTRAKVELGRKLFSDKRLSADGTVACVSCHDPQFAFGDRHALAIGMGGQTGARRAPRLVNRGYGTSFFWDGRAQTLEQQVMQPIANPLEMASSPRDAAARAGVGEGEMRDALASYVRTILSGNSAFDRYMAGDTAAMSATEQLGLRLFTTKADCSGCHVGPNFTDERFHNTGAGNGNDPGRASVTGREEDRGAFKTPSLRDAARTPPYMHDGSLATLEDVIEFYDKGGRANAQLDPEIRPLHLTAPEKAALALFVRALNGTVRDGL